MLKGYRTIIFNFVAMVLPALDSMDVTHVLSPQAACYYTMIVTIGNALLRFYTTSPIFNKGANAGAS